MRLRLNRLTWREIDGELVVLDLSNSTYFTANRTATVLVQALADGATFADLVQALVATFDVDEETATADVKAFLGQLESQELLDPDQE